MDPVTTEVLTVMSPMLQWGFAGFAFLLLAILCWFINKLMSILQHTTEVIGKNTEAIASLGELSRRNVELSQEIHDKMLSRTCMLERKQ